MFDLRVTGRQRVSAAIATLAFVVLTVGCQDSSRTAEKPATPQASTAQPAATPSREAITSPWVAARRSWPDTMHWVLNAEDEIEKDGLLFRLRSSAIQSFVGGPRAKNHPVLCWFEMTIRPIAEWPLAKGLALDSVVYFDPVRHARLPTLRMLSSERLYREGTVRTRFTNDMAKPCSPELTDGQMLEPTAYFTWDSRTITVTARPAPIKFVHELPQTPAFEDSLQQKWGPQ
ncbi:MAG: hypothetical protein AB1792_02510 [Candidatus Zixiibacteriota bacterium]